LLRGERRGYEVARLADRSAISLDLGVQQANGDRFDTIRNRKLLRLTDDSLAAAWV